MKSVDAVTLRKNLGQYVNEAYYRGDEFIIKRAGKPVAALVPLMDLEKLELLKTQGFKALQNLWKKNRVVSFKNVLRDANRLSRHSRLTAADVRDIDVKIKTALAKRYKGS